MSIFLDSVSSIIVFIVICTSINPVLQGYSIVFALGEIEISIETEL